VTKKKGEVRKVKNMERVREIKAKLERHFLSVQWLVWRLYADHGLSVNRSGLSHILSGERVSGEQTVTVIEACEAILDHYESVYTKKEGA
jgi:hypothetical protein